MKIVKIIDSDNYVINAGSNQGLRLGDKVVVYLLGEEIFDPESGKSMGILELPKLQCHVTHVQDTMAIIRSNDAKPKGGLPSTISMLQMLGGTAGDSSPYNFLSSDQRKVVVGDLVKKLED